MCKNKASCVHVACNIHTSHEGVVRWVWSCNRCVVIGCGLTNPPAHKFFSIYNKIMTEKNETKMIMKRGPQNNNEIDITTDLIKVRCSSCGYKGRGLAYTHTMNISLLWNSNNYIT